MNIPEKNIKNKLSKLPDSPGAYLFYNTQRQIVYVGKASSLRSRVRSYFIGQRNPRPIEAMIGEVADIRWVTADSALEAAILESNLIKKYRPKYNVVWKDDKSWNYLVLTNEDYPQFTAIREHEMRGMPASRLRGFRYVFGPYPGLNVKAALKILRRIFSISFCRPGSGRACLYRQMGQCLGVCTGEISAVDYRRKVIRPLTMFLRGKKKNLVREIDGQMKNAAAANNFEEAARLRDQLGALRRIRDMALINESFVRDIISRGKSLRIEGYDISNLGATGKVGSMVVFDARGPVKSEYRKFLIKKVIGQSDVACLEEVLERRLKHDEWSAADVWLIDGGKPQVNRAVKIASGRIPVIVGIAKGAGRRKNDLVVGTKTARAINWAEKNINLLIEVRDEAHRFALSFQRQKRRIYPAK